MDGRIYHRKLGIICGTFFLSITLINHISVLRTPTDLSSNDRLFVFLVIPSNHTPRTVAIHVNILLVITETSAHFNTYHSRKIMLPFAVFLYPSQDAQLTVAPKFIDLKLFVGQKPICHGDFM